MHLPTVLGESIQPNSTVLHTALPRGKTKQLKAHTFLRRALTPQSQQDQSRPDQNRYVRLRSLGKVLSN